MKTLKKTLCLVLAVVMVVGALVLPASAKDYGDKASIDKDYTTAVNNLTDWKVMEGDAAGNFKPKASIQRQEMAAIIYRLLTGDNEGYGKDNSAIYTPYAAKFTDVDAKGWAAGYIGYCANKGIIVGTNAEGTLFDPARPIPGNDVLCMLLRALGYGMNKEYQGADWAKHIASDATRLHLTDGITSKLDAVSQRQEVAQMTYKAATAARVTWSNAEKDYIPYRLPNQPNSEANIPLVKDTAGAPSTAASDKFGRLGDKTVKHTVEFTYPVKAVTDSWTDTTKPVSKTYWTPVTECDVADDLELDVDTTYKTYTNGIKNVGSEVIEPLDTVNTIGHQGRQTIVYKTTDADGKNIIVYIDTYLAKVTKVTAEVTDPAGHVIKKAETTLTVYGNNVANPNASNTPAAITATATIATDKYAVGEMLRVNVVTKDPYNSFDGQTFTIDEKDVEKVTAKSVTVSEIVRDSANWTPDGGKKATLTEVGFKGTDGETYLYNYTYGYNTAAAPVVGSSVQRILTQDIGKTYTVYLDSHNNVLGVDTNPVSNVGVVTSVNIALVTGTTNQYVIAYNMLMPDGSTPTVYGVDPTTKKPYTSAANAQKAANTFWNNTTNPAPVVEGENKDAGILAEITPIANGYYTVAVAGKADNSFTGTLGDNTVLERGEANAFALANLTSVAKKVPTANTYPKYIGTVKDITDILVDDTTVYFVANYPYNHTANEYQFKDFTIRVGFKDVMDMSYSTVIGNSSTATAPLKDGTANIDGQEMADLDLEVSAFDTDADGYADFVLVLNANKQQVPEKYAELNYAYLMTNPQFATTGNDKNEYGAIIEGEDGKTLTVTNVASSNVLNTGLYTYTNKTTNGWDTVTYVSPIFANPCWGVGNNIGWLVKDDVLVVNPDATAALYADNRDEKTDKYLTLADNCQVYLVNPYTGKSVPQTYALTTLDNVDVYGTNEIVYQFDADGYVDLIYIVEKGLNDDTKEPGEVTAKGEVKVNNLKKDSIIIKESEIVDGKMTITVTLVNVDSKIRPYATISGGATIAGPQAVSSTGSEAVYTFTVSGIEDGDKIVVDISLVDGSKSADEQKAEAQQNVAEAAINSDTVKSGTTTEVRKSVQSAAEALMDSGATASEAVEAITTALKEAGVDASAFNKAASASTSENPIEGLNESTNYMAEVVSNIMKASGDTVKEQLAAAKAYIDWFIDVTSEDSFESGTNEYDIVWENLTITKGTTTDYVIELEKELSSKTPKGDKNGLANIFYGVGAMRKWSDSENHTDTDLIDKRGDSSIASVVDHVCKTDSGKLSSGVTVTVKFYETKDATKEAATITILFKTKAAE